MTPLNSFGVGVFASDRCTDVEVTVTEGSYSGRIWMPLPVT